MARDLTGSDERRKRVEGIDKIVPALHFPFRSVGNLFDV